MRGQTVLLKREIEAKLAHRIPAALSPLAQQAPRLHPLGIPQLNDLLGGGLPFGSTCEVTGSDGSGRTSVALSLLSSASAEGVCAYIDVSGTLSPQSAAAAGVNLANLLWVHFAACGQQSKTQSSSAASVRPFEVKSDSHRPIYSGCGRSHPRSETKKLAPALEQMLFDKKELRKRKMEGTPGHPNQPLGLHTASQDQVEWERFNLRKVDETDPLRRMDRQAADAARVRAARVGEVRSAREPKPKSQSDQLGCALRATDQVLQSGGFRVVVLDLASLDAKEALRIPSATWFRYRRAAQESDAILLLLTREPCARSSAACVLECSAGALPKVQGVLTAASYSAEIARQRTEPAVGKKAMGRTTSWDAMPLWIRAAES